MNKERAKEILIKYKDKTDLFNWCDEYEQFVNNNICCLVNEEAEFMLKASYEDSESPLSYDDIDFYYYDFDEISRDLEIEFIDDDEKTQKEKDKLKAELKELIEGEDIDEIEDWATDNLFGFDRGSHERQKEIFQWFIVSGDIAQDIEDNGGIILNSNWFGRETFGQSLSMDYIFIKIYINRLKRWFDEDELKQIGY